MQGYSRLLPMQTAQLTGQLGCIRSAALRLGLRCQGATLKRCQHFAHPLCPSLCEPCPQTHGVLFRGDGTLFSPQYGSGVEVLGRVGHAGARIVGCTPLVVAMLEHEGIVAERNKP